MRVEINNFQGMTGSEIREQNREITLQTRELAALTGALWYQIEARELWKPWGYPTFVEAVVAEAPRAYSTVRECILNYSYFVEKKHMLFGEFEKLVILYGNRGVSEIRKEETRGEEDGFTQQATETPEQVTAAALPADGILGEENALTPLTAQAYPPSVYLGGAGMIARLYQWVTRRYRFNPEQDELVQQAIAHIKWRCKRRCRRVISNDEALALMAAEYCSEKALREPMPIGEAA